MAHPEYNSYLIGPIMDTWLGRVQMIQMDTKVDKEAFFFLGGPPQTEFRIQILEINVNDESTSSETLSLKTFIT